MQAENKQTGISMVVEVKKTGTDGIVIGKAKVIQPQTYEPEKEKTSKTEVAQEEESFYNSMKTAREELARLAMDSEIFAGHLVLAQDQTLEEDVIALIQKGMSAQNALDQICNELYRKFRALKDEHIRERAADIQDVRNRIMRILQGKPEINVRHFSEPVILVARDLLPSDTAIMDIQNVLAMITEEGGATSHVCIMAKEKGIPALTGAKGILSKLRDGDIIAMDAGNGKILINPDEVTRKKYEKLVADYQKKQQEFLDQEQLPAVTKDGIKITIMGNAGNMEDISHAVSHHVEGIGLFRSESLYMQNTHFPTEEEQFEVYREAAERCGGELTIRTLDIGGDKELSYYRLGKEENPFLGFRAIRISLKLKEIFKTQLRAVLRASHYGKVRLMYPMIISVDELTEANQILEECRQELRENGNLFDEKMEVGMMIETPASVLLAEEFAEMVDFFSIGTNDLTQYLLAVDRGNTRIEHLYNPYHPAVIRAVKAVIEAGEKKQIRVGMCGELAGDEKAAKLLVGLGLTEFSMAVGQAAKIKAMIRTLSREEARRTAERILSGKNGAEIEKYMET